VTTSSLHKKALSKVRIAKALIRFSRSQKKLAGITQSLTGLGKSPVDLIKFMSGVGDLPAGDDQIADSVKDDDEDEEAYSLTDAVPTAMADLPTGDDQTAELEDDSVKDDDEDEEAGLATSLIDMMS